MTKLLLLQLKHFVELGLGQTFFLRFATPFDTYDLLMELELLQGKPMEVLPRRNISADGLNESFGWDPHLEGEAEVSRLLVVKLRL